MEWLSVTFLWEKQKMKNYESEIVATLSLSAEVFCFLTKTHPKRQVSTRNDCKSLKKRVNDWVVNMLWHVGFRQPPRMCDGGRKANKDSDIVLINGGMTKLRRPLDVVTDWTYVAFWQLYNRYMTTTTHELRRSTRIKRTPPHVNGSLRHSTQFIQKLRRKFKS